MEYVSGFPISIFSFHTIVSNSHTDIWRACRGTSHLLVSDQLRYLVFRAAIYRCHELWLDIYLLRNTCGPFGFAWYSYDSLGQVVASELQDAI